MSYVLANGLNLFIKGDFVLTFKKNNYEIIIFYIIKKLKIDFFLRTYFFQLILKS